MINSTKPQGYRKREDAIIDQELQEQEVISTVTDTLEAQATPITLGTQEVSERSFLSTAVSCAPYVIMVMGVYMIWTRARKLFKPTNGDNRKEAQG